MTAIAGGAGDGQRAMLEHWQVLLGVGTGQQGRAVAVTLGTEQLPCTAGAPGRRLLLCVAV